MYQPGPLIAEGPAGPPNKEGRQSPRPVLVASVLLLALVLVLVTIAMTGGLTPQEVPAGNKRVGGAPQSQRQLDPARLVLADPAQIEALTQVQAQAANAGRPVSSLPNPSARAFVLGDDAPGYARALACLTAAIYYEAAYEPIDGQRAVAQVVLNRLRHRLYPHTVCGVVFQGAERPTGCQFTFACDGSLARAPVPIVWARVRTIAQQALAGYVSADAGLSTHYHADYVVPYWSGIMVKTAVIGQHAFYRMPDGYGSPSAFNSHYQQSEPQVAFGMAAGLAGGGDVPSQIVAVDNNARPVLDQSGAIVGGVGRTGEISGTGFGRQAETSTRNADVRKGDGRWIMGMDGNRKSEMPAPSISYESTN